MPMLRERRGLHAGLVPALVLLVAAIAPAQAQDWIYSVRPGDNLWNLSEKYLPHTGYTRRLQAHNQIEDPYHIPPGSSLRIPVAWMRATPTDATVINVHGEISFTTTDGAQPQSLAAGTSLSTGARIFTGADSNATVEFHDGSRLVVQSDSELRLDELRAYADSGMLISRTRLQQGRSESRVQPARGPGSRFEIRTPAAVTAVRGTDYRVSADDAGQSSRAEVLGGKVAVSSGHRTRLVPAGFGTVVAAAGKPPLPPVRLLPAPDLGALPPLLERVPIDFALPPVAGASGYRVQVAANAELSPLLFDRTFPSPLIRGIELPDGEYLLRARAVDERGLEGLNAQRRFTLNARPEPPFPIQPAADAGVLEQQPVFAWSSQASASAYHFQLARDAAFGTVLLDRPDLPDNGLTSPLVLAPGTYYWRVATLSATEGKGPFSDPQPFRRPPPGPALEAPEVSEQALNVRWRAGQPGQSYAFQLARDEQFTEVLAQASSGEPRVTLERPKGGRYYMHVRTIDVDGYMGPYGPVQRIDIPYDFPGWLLAVPVVLAAVLCF